MDDSLAVVCSIDVVECVAFDNDVDACDFEIEVVFEG